MMTHPRAGTKGGVVLLAVLAWASAAAGKTPPDLTPRVDSPAYWDEHVLLHAVVGVQAAGDQTPVQVLDQFSGQAPAPATMQLNMKEVWLEPYRGDDEPQIKLEAYEHLLIAYSSGQEPGQVVVYKPGNDEALVLVESCRLIQELRQAGDWPAGLQRATKAGDAGAQRYVLHALQSGDLKHMDDKLAAQVSALRADAAGELQMRMAASDLLQAVAAAKGQKKDDWEWIAGVLRQERTHGLEAFRTLTERMLVKDGEERLKTIDLICELAGDMEGPARRRAAVMMAGDIDRLIGGDGPQDEGNVKIMKFCAGRISDPVPMVRLAAAYALWQMCSALPRRLWPAQEWVPMMQSAAAAIQKAEKLERWDVMKGWLHHDRVMIEEWAASAEAKPEKGF